MAEEPSWRQTVVCSSWSTQFEHVVFDDILDLMEGTSNVIYHVFITTSVISIKRFSCLRHWNSQRRMYSGHRCSRYKQQSSPLQTRHGVYTAITADRCKHAEPLIYGSERHGAATVWGAAANRQRIYLAGPIAH